MNLTIHTGRIVRRDADRFFGINLNYIRDRDSNRPSARPLDEALAEMGVRWLRFPGGEKSDFHLWSEPPYSKPAPRSLGKYTGMEGDRMDFDEFIQHVRLQGAEPYVVVGCDSEARTGRTMAEWLEDAVAWVRYSKSKSYGVRYWEVGNENWHNGTALPADMAKTVAEFSKAMKAEDPAILVGAGGNDEAWWREFLPVAAPHLDFLAVSEYTGWEWKSYEGFLAEPESIGTTKVALDAVERFAPQADRSRLRVIVAETNAIDYSEDGWPHANDLGHALATFSTLGQLLSEPKVASAMVWNTRWMQDAEAPKAQWYALGPYNELTATGKAVQAWGRFVQPLLLEVEGNGSEVQAFASCSHDEKSLTVWLLNRGRSEQKVGLAITGPVFTGQSCGRLRGADEFDRAPDWETPPLEEALVLPALSVTALSMRG